MFNNVKFANLWIFRLPKRMIIAGLKSLMILIFYFPGLVKFFKRVLEYSPKWKSRFYRFRFDGNDEGRTVTYEDLSVNARRVCDELQTAIKLHQSET